MSSDVINFTIQAILGGVVGYASGMFGVGGGFMLTPLLHSILGIPMPVAVGSGLSQMIAVGFAGAREHAKSGNVDVCLTAWMFPGIVAGSFAGSFILKFLTSIGSIEIAGKNVPLINPIMNSIFLVMLIGIAIKFWREDEVKKGSTANGPWCWSGGPYPVSLPCSGIKSSSILSLMASGLLVGTVSGLLGIGGGVLLIPILVYGYGIRLRAAIGTSSLLILVSSLSGTVIHALAGHVDIRLVFALMVGSTIGVKFGASHSQKIHTKHLTRAFVMLILLVAGIILFRFFK